MIVSGTSLEILEHFELCLEEFWQCFPLWGILSLWTQMFEQGLIPIFLDYHESQGRDQSKGKLSVP